MNTEMKELNLNEMEQACGGGAVHACAKKKLFNKVSKWLEHLLFD